MLGGTSASIAGVTAGSDIFFLSGASLTFETGPGHKISLVVRSAMTAQILCLVVMGSRLGRRRIDCQEWRRHFALKGG